jgi:Na+-transporting NADH:ubiquinone oxidoreductase subunit A
MANPIKLKKGLDIKLKGKAELSYGITSDSDTYAIVPDDFYGITPKLAVREGDMVKAGSPVLFDKNHPELKIVSPVSGIIKAINRGERRKILSIEVEADKNTIDFLQFDKKQLGTLTGDQTIEALLECGLFAFIKQRPYDIVANPQLRPKAIFISCFDTAPLAPDYDFILANQAADFQRGIDALAKIAKVNLGVQPNSSKIFAEAKNAEITVFSGPHPAGNVGVQIHHVNPINKGEIVWTVNPADVALIGKFFERGIVELERTVALTGPEVLNPVYVKTLYGVKIATFFHNNHLNEGRKLRFINGNVLTGTQTSADGYLSATTRQITVIPEGDDVDEMFGWIMPRFRQFSVSRTYFSWFRNIICSKKPYEFDARIKGGERHMIASGEYDKVLPMDIYPEFLLKAIIAYDIDKMEALGIYEIAPEDFALCEFVDSSKVELQKIIRQGLDALYKDMN